MQFSFNDILKLLPELMLALLALLIIVGDLFAGDATEEQRFRDAASTTALGLGMIFVVVLLQSGYIIDRIVNPALDPATVVQPVGRVLLGLLRNLQSAQGTTLLNNALIIDDLLMVARLLFIGAALVTALLVQDHKRIANAAEFFGFLVLAVVGMNLMAGTGELVSMYVALELASVTLYILASYGRSRTSEDAHLNYPVFGLVSSGILLYGLSFLYGYAALSGNPNATSIPTIAQAIGQGGTSPLLILATIFVIIGMSYKLAVVPLHAWTAEVYQRSSPAVTALLSTAAVAAAFVFLFRIVGLALQPLAGSAAFAPGFGGWASILAVIAILTMVVGNFAALRTRVARRILAYTAVAHAGFLLIALVGAYTINREGQVAWTDFGVRSLIYYLIAYVIASLGAWGVLAAITNSTTVSDIGDLHGLHRRNSGLAWLFLIFVLSLAGIPPLSGFWARFFVLAAGWETGATWLVIVGVVTILLSAVAYLRLVRVTFAAESSIGLPMAVGRSTRFALIVAALFVLVMGIFPTLFLPIIETAAQTAPPQ